MHTLSVSRPRKPRSDRRQRVPPALTRGSERVDGISILDEVSGDLGLLLWRSARNVTLWAETPVEQRADLFPGDAARSRTEDLAHVDVHPELRGPLSVLTELLARPGQVDLLRLVNACRRIAGWAEQRGELATALEFAQAAALAAPESASLAYAVGRLARRRADYDRAESWYTRAAVQGRQSSDWRSYALAFSGMGNLHMQRGNYPAARRAHLRCLKVSERQGLLEVAGDAYHDLFAVETEVRAGFEADALAAAAFRAYGPNSPKIYRLAYDISYHWALQGFFTGALRVAQALVPHITEPAMAALLQGVIARAAGGVGRRDAFDSAVWEANRILNSGASGEMAARTLLGLAHGAMSLGEWELASRWASQSQRTASVAKEGRVALEAEAVHDAAERRVQMNRPTPAQADPATTSLVDDFVGALVRKPALAAA
jgi:tetratricopeptide (TPR) repeat protein